MWRLLQSCCCCWWIFSLILPTFVLLWADCHPVLPGIQTESQALIKGLRSSTAAGTRHRRAATEETYWAYSGMNGPDEGWASAYPECREKNQSPINIVDQDSKVSAEYQELTLEGFDTESSNKTSMKNTGKTVAIMLKDDYFVRGAGLPGRFKAEKVEFHWGPSNGSEGSEHSINGWRYPVEMQVYMYNSDDFDSLSAALREKRIIAAIAVFFQVGGKDNPAVNPIIHGLKGVVHHEKETVLEPFVLKDLLPSSLGSYYRYTGSLTTPPCSKVVEWIIFSRPIYVSYKQLEAFYSIFTTEQQDHVKSVEYLRSNFRPVQSLDNRHVFKSSVKDAWLPDLTDSDSGLYGTEASKVCSSAPINMKVQHVNGSALVVRWAHPEVTYHPPILHFLVSYSWTAHDDSYEETHVIDAKHRLEAIISPVSPDVLYLFRVQAVCMNDMRSDFSQSMLFRANTTRIFEGTRIVKTGMPTVSPASSADMAPISSGSSTWTSSGIPFSFVSMATGIGPSSSGSQATVASLLTSTLLAGLGFSGGVISSFPSSVWPNRASTHNPISSIQLTEPTESANPYVSAVMTTKDDSETGGQDRGNSKGQGDDGEKEGQDKEEEEEEEEDKEGKKSRKGSGGVSGAGKRNNRTVTNEPANKTQEATAKKKKETGLHPSKMSSHVEDQPEYSHKPIDSNPTMTREATNGTAVFPAPKDPAETHGHRIEQNKKLWPFSIHADDHSRVKLRPLPEKDSEHTYYINANFVDGHNKTKAYIAGQGCLKSTFEDIWTMVQNAGIIVMITNLVEKGRGGKVNPEAQAQSEWTVLQYHYTQWPDMSVAGYILPVLTFVRRSSVAQMCDMEPLLVHCCAGVDRTGTDMVINRMLQQIRDKSTVNVLGFLKHIRTQLNYLVHTEEHYVFIHDALMEAIFWKETEVVASPFHSYFNSITAPRHNSRTHLEKLFKAEDELTYFPRREEAMKFEAFTLTLISKDRLCLSCEEQISIHDFILEATQDDYVLYVRYVQCPKWTNPDVLISSTFKPISVIKEEAITCDGPTIVHDELGSASAGTLCVLSTMSQQLESEGAADADQVAKMIDLMRPGIFTEIDQCQYLYKAQLSLMSTKENSLGLLARNIKGTMASISSLSNQVDNMESPV